MPPTPPSTPEFTDVFCCPKCRGPLTARPDDSALECAACKLAYPVIDEIPNFIIEEALPLK
jgi:uncharacterized protein YbaR (Trm112 family)